MESEKTPLMKNNESLSWLYNLFNSSNFDAQQNIDYLYSYPNMGIHFYLSRLTDFDERYTLHLVHIMFYHCEDDISYPIMDLLVKKCLYDKPFSLKLFFILKSYRKYLTKHQIGFYRLIIQRIMECDKYRRDISRKTVVLESFSVPEYLKSHSTEKLDSKFSFLGLKSKKNMKKSLENNSETGNDENKSNLRKKRYMLRTRPILNLNRGSGDLSSIFLLFCSASAFFYPQQTLENLIDYEKMFHTFKAHSIIFPKKLDTTFKGCVNFLDDLVMISFRIKNLPMKIRERALEIELEYLNNVLPADISLPFSDGKKVLNFNSEYSKTLNSVKNAPYILIYECGEKIEKKKQNFCNDIYLLRQLYALEKTGNENQPIKDKIIEQLMFNSNPRKKIEVDLDEKKGSQTSLNEKEIKSNKKLNWPEIVKNIKDESQFANLEPDVKSIIIKTGSELGPELIASEILSQMKEIFEEERLRIWVKPYQIYSVYHNAGFVEVISDAYSIHEIKKLHNSISTGKTFLKKYYYEKYRGNIEKAQENFLESLVGYSLVSYFLGLKDRHNGNILIDGDGHLVHVDFGFVLGLHPGIFCVETAPFKMSSEYIYMLGDKMDEFKKLFIQGFVAIRKHHKKILQIMEICMGNPKYRFLDSNAVDTFKKRLRNDINNRELEDYIISLIDWSLRSTTTGLYDSYQYFSNGYMK